MNVYQFELPFPPTINDYKMPTSRGTRKNKHGGSVPMLALVLTKKARNYRRQVLQLFWGSNHKTLHDRLRMRIEFCAPDRRTRDLDNYVKGLQDALTHAKVYEDDSQIDELIVKRGAVTQSGKALVQIDIIATTAERGEYQQQEIDHDDYRCQF